MQRAAQWHLIFRCHSVARKGPRSLTPPQPHPGAGPEGGTRSCRWICRASCFSGSPVSLLTRFQRLRIKLSRALPVTLIKYSGFSRSSLLTKKQDQAARKIMRFLRRCRHRYISPRLCTLLITTNKQPCSSEPLINSDIKPPPPGRPS